jgi:hypothetical protein
LKFHIILNIVSFSKWSKIPSQPKIIKSLFLLSLKKVIEGLAIITFGIPPRSLIFDSISPKDLVN